MLRANHTNPGLLGEHGRDWKCGDEEEEEEEEEDSGGQFEERGEWGLLRG